MANKTQAELLYRGQHQENVQDITLNMRKAYLGKLEDKERNQERNIHGLVQYAKQLRAELEKYKGDVEMTEKIVADL